MDDKIADSITRKEQNRRGRRTGRPSKVKRLQGTLEKSTTRLKQIETSLSVAKKLESEAFSQAKAMER